MAVKRFGRSIFMILLLLTWVIQYFLNPSTMTTELSRTLLVPFYRTKNEIIEAYLSKALQGQSHFFNWSIISVISFGCAIWWFKFSIHYSVLITVLVLLILCIYFTHPPHTLPPGTEPSLQPWARPLEHTLVGSVFSDLRVSEFFSCRDPKKKRGRAQMRERWN